MSWLIIMETEKAGKRQSAVLSCGFAWSQDVPVWEKAFTACSVKG